VRTVAFLSRLRDASFGLMLAAGLVSPSAAHAQGAGYWHTSGSLILDSNNQQVRIAGINWYGFETTDAVVHGLYAQDYKAILQTVKNNGYNTIRIPLSNQMVETPSSNLNITYSNGANSDLQGLNSLQVLDKIVSYAGTLGLKIILDNHRSEAGNSAEGSGLWYTSSYPESAWIQDWTMLANRYLYNSTVIGMDLRNEPHNATSGGACWDCGGANDWHLAAERAGNAVLSVNPKLLVFVEGTDAYNNNYYWWGGNLEGVAHSPVVLSVANQLVYSAHDYGPEVSSQNWFNGSTSYASLSAVWNTNWAYISQNNIAPVWVGEFGTDNSAAGVQSNSAGSEGQWFQSMVEFLNNDQQLNWTYWALNGEDTLALLDSNYDSTPVSSQKQSMLATLQFALSSGIGSTTPPAAPSGMTATATSASQVNLAWTASTTSGVYYTVYFGTSPSPVTVLVSGLTAPSYQATSLNASTLYYFDVVAVNSNGTSSASNTASATTKAAPAVPPAPSGLTATAASSSQINLAWTASSTSGVTYNVYSGSSLIASGVSASSYSATGLTASTSYTFTVAAANANGTSASSNPASATTQAASASVPAAPSGLSASPASASAINLQWQASSTSGVTYNVYEGTVSGVSSTLVASNLSGTTYAASGLADSTTYYFTVKAANSAGTSAASNQASATTQTASPATPTSLTATAASSTQINLAWAAVPNTGATYSVYYGTQSGAENTLVASGINGTSYTVPNLTASTTYYFVVRSVSAGGTSSPSTQAGATTLSVAVPLAPAGLTATATSTTQINLSWSAVSGAGVTYSIYSGTVSGSTNTLVTSGLSATTFNVTGLSANTTYYFTVKASSSNGTSGASNQASATTQALPAPGAPSSLSAVSVSPSEIDLSWTASSTTGVTYSVFSGSTQIASGVTATSYAATGLAASTAYSFTVKAVNANGSSTATNVASATTQAAPAPTAPAVPTGLTAAAVSSTQINLAWTASTTVGVTYNVYSGSSLIASGVSATSYGVSGLTPNTAYSFTVTTSTANASSTASNVASATTQAAPTPNAPSSLTATATSSSQINLAWTASTTAGVTYSVFSGSTQVATVVSGMSYNVTGLTASTTYSYTVTAVLSGTSSAASNAASATTQAAPAGGCHVAYVDQSDWGTGFTGNISITNTSSKTLSTWTLTWTYSGNQQVYQAWDGTSTQSGEAVTIVNASWNGAIAAGATISGIGFNANYSGSNVAPTTFYLNGVACK